MPIRVDFETVVLTLTLTLDFEISGQRVPIFRCNESLSQGVLHMAFNRSFNGSKILIAAATLATLAGSLAGCAKVRRKELSKEDLAKPVATKVLVTPLPALMPAPMSANHRVEVELTLRRDLLLDREFLYGFDLQYSSGTDSKFALVPQAQAIGHVPATFRLIGDRLQLLSNQDRLFESDINHPELLINEYKGVRSDGETITIAFDRPGHLVNMTMNGTAGPEVKMSWLRSFEYVAQGNYILQETALLLADGQVQTYMESIFPRDTLVPAEYRGIENEASLNPAAERYRFLTNEKVYVDRPGLIRTVRQETSFANRFHVKAGETIDWYVTKNAPANFMNEMKSGVEGWNRYFIPQMGYAVIQFKGYLPAGVKLGDPRFNVINFDSVAQAGAAYESQAADPMTGIQSHSLIYMPYAWYNIARGLYSRRHPDWKNSKNDMSVEAALRTSAEPRGTAALFGRERRVLTCMRSAEEALASLEQPIDAASDAALDDFGRRVFIATLFHEVGHALGMAHNFKGSMAFDGSKPVGEANPTTWSVMDYNYYQHETGLVSKPGATDGPSQEYDRQMISQLYNDGKDVVATDPVIPACDDTEADSTDGGVDPFCTRYDAESNPLTGLQHAFDKVTLDDGAKGVETMTLAEALRALEHRLITRLNDPGVTKNAADVKSLAPLAAKAAANLVGYYVSEGAQSLRVNLVNNAKSLRKFRVVPDGVNENAHRTTYMQMLKAALAMDSLPGPASAAAQQLGLGIRVAILSQERFGATPDERAALADLVVNAIDSTLAGQVTASFAKLRTLTFGELAYKPELPFSAMILASTASTAPAASSPDILSIENLVTGFLKINVLRGAFGSSAPELMLQRSRHAAATGLASFHVTGEIDLADSDQQLVAELTKAKLAGEQDAIDQIRELIIAIRAKD